MIEVVEGEEEKSIVVSDVRLTFQRTADRWSHSVHIGPYTFVRSLEETPDRNQPRDVLTPTYQDIHLQSEELAVLVMLVGQSGPHHFSAVFRVTWDRVNPTRFVTIDVDIADRCLGPVDSLSSTYLVDLGDAGLLAEEPDWMDWLIGDAHVDLFFNPKVAPPGKFVVGREGGSSQEVRISAKIEPGVSTHRLSYLWSILI